MASPIPQGTNIVTRAEERLDARSCALLVIDFLNDICHPEGQCAKQGRRPVTSIRDAITCTGTFTNFARKAGLAVVHIQLTALPNKLSDSPAWQAVRERATFSTVDMCIDGTWGNDFVEELAPLPGELVIKKFRYSGFAGTNLDLLLRSRGISTLLLAGCSTNVCVTSTGFDAINLDYHVVVVEDCVASWDDQLHHAALQTFRHRVGRVIPSQQLIKLLDNPVPEHI